MGLTSNPQFSFEQPSERYKQPITPYSNTRIDLIHGGKMDVETADYIDPETAGPNADYVWRTRNIKFCDHCGSKAKHNIKGNHLCQSHAEEYYARNMH